MLSFGIYNYNPPRSSTSDGEKKEEDTGLLPRIDLKLDEIEYSGELRFYVSDFIKDISFLKKNKLDVDSNYCISKYENQKPISLVEKTTTTFKELLGNYNGNYLSVVDGTIRLTEESGTLSENLFDVGGFLLYISWSGEKKYNIGKYVGYQCSSCLKFEKCVESKTQGIVCLLCNKTPECKNILPATRPIITIDSIDPTNPLPELNYQLSGMNIYIISDGLRLESVMHTNKNFDVKYGTTNLPLVVFITESTNPNIKNTTSTVGNKRPFLSGCNIILDSFAYFKGDSRVELAWWFYKRWGLHNNSKKSAPRLPLNLSTPAWAMVRYITNHILKIKTPENIQMYKLFDTKGKYEEVIVDTRISGKLFESAFSNVEIKLDAENSLPLVTRYMPLAAYCLYKAICKRLYGEERGLTLADVILSISGRKIADITTDSTNVFCVYKNKLFLDGVNIQDDKSVTILEIEDKNIITFSFNERPQRMKRVGDFYLQTVKLDDQILSFKTGSRLGLYTMFTFYGQPCTGKILRSDGTLYNVYLNGGSIVTDWQSPDIKITLTENYKNGENLNIITTYWK